MDLEELIEKGENKNRAMQNNVFNIMYIFNDTALGGAAQSLLDMLKEIKKEVNPVVVMRKGSKIKEHFDALKIPCYELQFFTDYEIIGNVTREKKEEDFKYSYEAALQLIPILEKEKIQLIHINSSTSYFAAIAALMTGVPYVWHIRELMEEQFGCEFINNDLKQNLYHQADQLIAISDYVQQIYFEKYSVNTRKIYNGIDIEKYKINIDENINFKNVFLVAAMITPEKGQWDAICATEILIEKGYSDVQLIIAGARGGTYVWALNKYINSRNLDKNIKILPFQNDLSELHRQASYAITCSQNEALGRVTIEAMLGGNIVIGAKSGGTIEIIGEEEDRGFLYELHNSESLADAMIRAMKCSQEIKKQMLKRAQTYAEDTFNTKQYCMKLLDVYSEIISFYKVKNQKRFINVLEENYELVKNNEIMNKSEMIKDQRIDNQLLKSSAAFSLAVKWLEIKQKGYSLTDYFIKNNYRSVAIYGMAALGRRLYDELENTDVEIRYLLDRNPNGLEKVLEFVSLQENLIVDIIVVTVAAAEKQLVKEIKAIGYDNVIGLSDILDDSAYCI